MELPQRLPLLLFVAPYFPPVYYGGVVQVYLGLLSRLKGFRIVVVADRSHTSPATQQAWDADALRDFGIAVRRIDAFELHLRASSAPRNTTTRMRAVVAFWRNGLREWQEILQELKPDLVVCGGTYSAGWLMKRLPSSAPLINYLHGEELTMRVSPRLLMPVMRYYQMRSLRRAQKNIAVSSYTAALAAKLARISPEKITVLPNFVDTQRFRITGTRTELRIKLGWNEKLVLLTLARLEPRKGIDHALQALALLHKRGHLPPHWCYEVAGSGVERASLEALSQTLGLASHVHFRGFVPDGEVAQLYEAADLFLQPNREVHGDTEGFGVVFLEAGACGLAVIGGCAGGTADAIAEGVSGLRVDAESVEQIAAAVRTLACDDELRTRLGRQGAARVAAHFTVEQAAVAFGQLLQQVL